MQRMSDLLTRWLDGNLRQNQQQDGESAVNSSSVDQSEAQQPVNPSAQETSNRSQRSDEVLTEASSQPPSTSFSCDDEYPGTSSTLSHDNELLGTSTTLSHDNELLGTSNIDGSITSDLSSQPAGTVIAFSFDE